MNVTGKIRFYNFFSVLFFLMHIIAVNLIASWQDPDILIVNDDTSYISSFPLDEYLENINNKNIPGLKGCGSTTCLRGYVAIWTIENDSIFLTAITHCGKNEDCPSVTDADMSLMFGNKYRNNRVFAYWYTGPLLKPYGRLSEYAHMINYTSAFEFENLFQVKNGIVLKRKRFDYYIDHTYRKDRLNYFDTKVLIYNYIKTRINWDFKPADTTCYAEIRITLDKNGQIKGAENMNNACKRYVRVVGTAVKELGEFDIIAFEDEKIAETYDFNFQFNFVRKTITDINIDNILENQANNN